MTPYSPSPILAEGVARVTGRRIDGWYTRANCGGYTPALRLFVRFDDGRTAFVKAATNALTAGWLAKEKRFYERLDGSRFLPGYLGGASAEPEAAPEMSFLVLEDLGDCHWPPPWSAANIDAVLATLADVHAAASQVAELDLLSLADDLAAFPGWRGVAAEPSGFLSLGLCSPEWLDAALPELLAASASVRPEGDDLLHLDVRSDNLCFRPDGSAVLVDWNWACTGNGAFDSAGWAPSLHAEGGPPPEAIAPDAPEFAAWLAGFWANAAHKPPLEGSPKVREIQKTQLAVALPWAARALGLPPPGGQD